MMPASGKIDRRERLKNRELSCLVNSPGWTAAADHTLTTPGSEFRVTGRRTSMYLVKKISPMRTRRRSTALTFSELPPETPKADEAPVHGNKSQPRKDGKKSKLPKLEEKEKSEGSETSEDEAPPSKRKTRASKAAPKKAKERKDKQEKKEKQESTKVSSKKVAAPKGKSSIPKPVKQKSESRSTQRRNARLRPFSKQLPKSPDQSPKHILREKVPPENGVHDDDSEDIRRALSKSATIRMQRLERRASQDDERENEASVEEPAILDTSAADSVDGSMLNDSKSRCHIL